MHQRVQGSPFGEKGNQTAVAEVGVKPVGKDLQ
jgi:hypothetical protein